MKLSMANTFGPYPVVRRTDVGTAVFSRWKSTRTCGMRYRVSKTPSQQLGSYVSEGCRQRANRKSETRGESASSRRLSLWTYGPVSIPALNAWTNASCDKGGSDRPGPGFQLATTRGSWLM